VGNFAIPALKIQFLSLAIWTFSKKKSAAIWEQQRMGGQQRLESSREFGAEASWGQQQFGGSCDVGAAGDRQPQRLGGGQQQG